MLHGRIDILRARARRAARRPRSAAGDVPVPSTTSLDRPLFAGTGDAAGRRRPRRGSPTSRPLSDDELRATIRELERRRTTSRSRRRVLQGKVDILRAERAAPAGGRGRARRAGRSRPDPRRWPDPDEPRLLPRVRLPEPGGRELLLALRRAPRREAPDENDAEPRARRGRRTSRPPAPTSSAARRSSCARAAVARGRASSPAPSRTLIGRSPECDVFLDDVTVSRRHAEIVRDGDDVHDPRPRQPQRDVRQPPPDRVRDARGRRRGPDRQVPADVPPPMSARPSRHRARSRLQTIGAVCERLRDEFPDISISKIRYLEDQGLLRAAAHARAATGCSRRPTSSGSRRSCGSSATSSCRSA